MSCHNIGHAMNKIMVAVLEMYDNKEISQEATIKICKNLRDGVWFCDGNPGEAVETISECRCGKCLKFFKKGDRKYSLWHINSREISKKTDDLVISPVLCEECFSNIIMNVTNDASIIKKEIEFIEKNYREDDYIH